VPPAACHILLLVNDPAIAASITEKLQEAGFLNIRTSSSIAGARQCWHAQLGKFDLFVTDFSLRDGGATGFIEELLKYKPDLRVILISIGREEVLDLETGRSGRLKVLAKPFSPGQLLDAVLAELRLLSARESAPAL
jgi:DNA-binding NtrC family response regulator